MKINAKTLSDFIKKVTINGSIPDGMLKFQPDGLVITVNDVSRIGAVSGFLKSSNFIEYSQMNVPIKSFATLISVLSSMTGNVSLSTDKNIFRIISDSNAFDMIMSDEQFLECNLAELPTLGHDGGFELDGNFWKTVEKNTQILRTTKIGVVAEVKSNMFYVRTGEDGFDKGTANIAVDYKDVSARYGPTFLEFISVMSGKLFVSFNNNYPILITSKDADSMIRWMIAPIVENNESSEASS